MKFSYITFSIDFHTKFNQSPLIYLEAETCDWMDGH